MLHGDARSELESAAPYQTEHLHQHQLEKSEDTMAEYRRHCGCIGPASNNYHHLNLP
jgi:hypothetical protein